jgi:hypothetical protein
MAQRLVQGTTRAAALRAIDAFLAESGMSDREFSMKVANNSRMVARLRRGEHLTLRSIEDATVPTGANVADVAVLSVDMTGVTIQDPFERNVSLAAAVTNPSGTLALDGVSPTVSSVTASPSSGTLEYGDTLNLTLQMSEGITLAGGVPTLALSGGMTASYVSAASSATSLVFRATVPSAGQPACPSWVPRHAANAPSPRPSAALRPSRRPGSRRPWRRK